MEMFVCIKQVPATNKVEVDETTGVLKRNGVSCKMNPYDLYALETALRLKAQYGGTVTVGTMGPPQAQAIIKEAYMMGWTRGMCFPTGALAARMYWQQAIRSAKPSAAWGTLI